MTPTYRLEFSESGGSLEKGIYMRSHRQAWRGRATPKRLQEWVFAYARSLQVGGVNAHISTMLGYVPFPASARIVRQRTGEIVATWKAGLFQVYE